MTEKWAVCYVRCTDKKVRVGVMPEDEVINKNHVVRKGLHPDYASAIVGLVAFDLELEVFDANHKNYEARDY